MSKVYFKEDRLKYSFLWMLIFAGASFLAFIIFPTEGTNWLASILMMLSGLSLVTGIWGTNDDSESPNGLACPKCKIFHPLLNINIDKDSKIYMYGEYCFRKRESDGLNIYPLLCLKCKSITEYAADPQNQSGHAVCGYEYFKTKKMTKKDYKNAYEYAEQNNHLHILSKLKKIKV